MRARRIVMPATARKGETIEIKTLVLHPMITGHSAAGANTAKRDIVHTFTALYDGDEIFRAELGPGIAANPLFVFTTVATVSGDIAFAWATDSGELITEVKALTVT
jgi:sulfur-oxidizing protein SoxZ